MMMKTFALELEVEVDFCCAEDVAVLELVVLELVVLGPTGEPVFSRNWMNRALERTRITVAKMTKVDRFFNRLDMTYGLFWVSDLMLR
jgi:hypothetical protein